MCSPSHLVPPVFSQFPAPLWWEPFPSECHERPVQQQWHPATGPAAAPAPGALRHPLPPACLPVWQPRLLQLLHYEELLFCRWSWSGNKQAMLLWISRVSMTVWEHLCEGGFFLIQQITQDAGHVQAYSELFCNVGSERRKTYTKIHEKFYLLFDGI